MEPNHNTQPVPHELPQPQEMGSSHPRETQPTASPESQTGPHAPVPPVPIPAQQTGQIPTAMQQPQSMPQPTVAAGTQHLIADDADLIEKEWVTKAKAIVAQTKDDPYQQNQEMTKVKADYLKKRYNKDLKLSEGQ